MAKTGKGSLVHKMYEKHAGTKRDILPEGKYVAQFRTLTLDLEGEEPKARLNGMIARGDVKGKNVTKFYNFADRTTKNGTEISGEQEFIRFMEDLAFLGIDTSEVDLEEIPTVIKEDKPLAQISVRVNGDYVNVSVIGSVEGDDEDDDDEDEEEEEEEETKPAPKSARPSTKPAPKAEEEDNDDDDDDDDSDEDEEDEDEESAVPEKGMTCVARPKGMKKPSMFTIKTVNKTKKTVDLVHDATGKPYPGIAWSEIELSTDDDE